MQSGRFVSVLIGTLLSGLPIMKNVDERTDAVIQKRIHGLRITTL